MATLTLDVEKQALLQAVEHLRAYLQCSDEIQAGIREMLEILNDPNTDEDDRDMALFTVADALFPNPHDGTLGMDLEESERLGDGHSEETRAALEDLDREEETFAIRLRTAMEDKQVTQEQLAERIGVGQPAVSNMLNRQCRPQRRTVQRIADALGMPPEDLWPGLRAQP